jgi:MoxR-like ATPase
MIHDRIFRGEPEPHDGIRDLPPPPPWRHFGEDAKRDRGSKFRSGPEEVEMVNAALMLRRPLLVTGKPGTGKSSLAYSVAHELMLGNVLLWPITTRSTLQQGLYNYDAVARLQDASLRESEQKAGGPVVSRLDIGKYIRLGPLGTALLGGRAEDGSLRPRVLLIDEIDKSDIDLPNDLLNIFEEGEFEIPELSRLPEDQSVVSVLPHDSSEKIQVTRGRVHCEIFPFVVLTSNGEREFPPAFLRRCLRLDIKPHPPEVLARIVNERLEPPPERKADVDELVRRFVELRDGQKKELATDQLLNAVYIALNGADPLKRDSLRDAIFRSLSEAQ